MGALRYGAWHYDLLKQAAAASVGGRLTAAAACTKIGSVYPATKHHGGNGSVDKSSYVSGGRAGGRGGGRGGLSRERPTGPHPCTALVAPAAHLCYMRSCMSARLFIWSASLHAQHLLLGVRLDGHVALGVGVAGLAGRRMERGSLLSSLVQQCPASHTEQVAFSLP